MLQERKKIIPWHKNVPESENSFKCHLNSLYPPAPLYFRKKQQGGAGAAVVGLSAALSHPLPAEHLPHHDGLLGRRALQETLLPRPAQPAGHHLRTHLLQDHRGLERRRCGDAGTFSQGSKITARDRNVRRWRTTERRRRTLFILDSEAEGWTHTCSTFTEETLFNFLPCVCFRKSILLRLYVPWLERNLPVCGGGAKTELMCNNLALSVAECSLVLLRPVALSLHHVGKLKPTCQQLQELCDFIVSSSAMDDVVDQLWAIDLIKTSGRRSKINNCYWPRVDRKPAVCGVSCLLTVYWQVEATPT